MIIDNSRNSLHKCTVKSSSGENSYAQYFCPYSYNRSREKPVTLYFAKAMDVWKILDKDLACRSDSLSLLLYLLNELSL